jgi:hypothetical protein
MYGYRKSHLALGIDPLASGEHLAAEVGLQAEIAPNKDE